MGRVLDPPAPPVVGLAWAARYADDRVVSGRLPDELPGAAVPRQGMTRFDLVQHGPMGVAVILSVELAEHERLVFKRRMRANLLTGESGAVALVIGVYDTRTDGCSLVYLNGDGTMALRCATGDIRPEPHEAG